MAEQVTRRQYLMASISTMLVWGLEYYDAVIYASVASIIEVKIIGGAPLSAAIITWFGFIVTFLARPLGAILFGYVGDRFGRRIATVLTSALVGLATLGIGLLPASPGLMSAVMLFSLRIAQGLGLGGEAGGGATWALELVPSRVRPYVSGIVYSGLAWGFLLSFLVALALRSTMGSEVFEDYGWRILYMTGVVPALLALVIRLFGPESTEWLRVRSAARAKVPLVVAVSKYWRNLLILMLIVLGLSIYNYAGPGYWAYILPRIVAPKLSLDPSEAYGLALTVGVLGGVGSVLGTAAMSGFMANKLGIRRTLLINGTLLLITSVFTTYLLFTMDPNVRWLSVVGGLLFGSIAGLQPLYYVSLFPTEVRRTAISFGWNVSTSLGILGSGLTILLLQASPASPLLLTLYASVATSLGLLLVIVGSLVNPRAPL